MTQKAVAAGNLGLCADYFSRGAFEITPRHIYALRMDQYAVKGKLGDYWETGMEGSRGWTVQEMDLLDKNVFKNRYNALHFMQKGDLVYILDSTGNRVLFAGVFGEIQKKNKDGYEIFLPVLYADLKMEKVLLSEAEFSSYFFKDYQGVIVKQKPIEKNEKDYFEKNRQEARADIHAYELFLATTPNRFVEITKGVVHELGPRQQIVKAKGSVNYTVQKFGQHELTEYQYDLKNETGETMNLKHYYGYAYIVSAAGELLYKGELPTPDRDQTKALIQPQNTVFLVVNLN